jgi:hypothetical protein
VFFFLHKRIILAVKCVEFVNDRMSYIILRGSWRYSIALNVHVPTVDKIDVEKDSFHKELQCLLINSINSHIY